MAVKYLQCISLCVCQVNAFLGASDGPTAGNSADIWHTVDGYILYWCPKNANKLGCGPLGSVWYFGVFSSDGFPYFVAPAFSTPAFSAPQETPNFLAPHMWPPNSPDLIHMDYEIWAVIQHRVYHRQIHSVDELKRRLIDVWCGLERRFLTKHWPLVRKTSSVCPCYRRKFLVQLVNWQCWCCPYLFHSMWLVWLLHL